MALHARYASEGVDPADVAGQAHHWWEALGPSEAAWVWEDAARLAAMRRLAFQAHLAAGRRLADRNAYEEAVTAYERALVLADEPAATAEAEGRIGDAYAKLARGDEAWEHALRAIDVLKQSGADVPAAQYVAPLAIATWNWGFFQRMPSEGEVLAVLAEGEAAARTQDDDAALAQMILGRAAFTERLTGTEEVEAMLLRDEPEHVADAMQRLAQLYMLNGRIGRSVELYRVAFEDLVARGAVINEPEAMLWYAVAVLNAGDAERAGRLADKLIAEATHRSAHTKQHGYGLAALVSLCRGEFHDVIRMGDDIRALAANPDSTFCLLGSVAIGYHAIAEILAGRPLPADVDDQVRRTDACLRTDAGELRDASEGDDRRRGCPHRRPLGVRARHPVARPCARARRVRHHAGRRPDDPRTLGGSAARSRAPRRVQSRRSAAGRRDGNRDPRGTGP